eukprot:TRINITY_DN935_c0_g1_i1.p1 TRINITY_DN935_c0_g1~~TRINITY_DN935_c0_g1_i1.p1  ORF type:complete len:353 (+),score=91.62 TRINITY_DN935_c0_g1_i1:52-1110(+)
MIHPDPNNTFWANDTEKLSYKLLSKMGWTPGKGLGSKEDGTVNLIQVQIKNDKLGIGVEKNTDYNWVASTIEFNSALSRLVPFSAKTPSVNQDKVEPTTQRPPIPESVPAVEPTPDPKDAPQTQIDNTDPDNANLKKRKRRRGKEPKVVQEDAVSQFNQLTTQRQSESHLPPEPPIQPHHCDNDYQRKRKRRRVKEPNTQNEDCPLKLVDETTQLTTLKEAQVDSKAQPETQPETQPQQPQIQTQTKGGSQQTQVGAEEPKKAHNHFIPKRVRRGKEVRNYSQQDLSAIFGFTKDPKEAEKNVHKPLVEDPTLKKSNKSMTDYFESKLKELHLRRKREDGNNYYQDIPSFSI